MKFNVSFQTIMTFLGVSMLAQKCVVVATASSLRGGSTLDDELQQQVINDITSEEFHQVESLGDNMTMISEEDEIARELVVGTPTTVVAGFSVSIPNDFGILNYYFKVNWQAADSFSNGKAVNTNIEWVDIKYDVSNKNSPAKYSEKLGTGTYYKDMAHYHLRAGTFHVRLVHAATRQVLAYTTETLTVVGPAKSGDQCGCLLNACRACSTCPWGSMSEGWNYFNYKQYCLNWAFTR